MKACSNCRTLNRRVSRLHGVAGIACHRIPGSAESGQGWLPEHWSVSYWPLIKPTVKIIEARHTLICSKPTSFPSWSTAVNSGICTGASGAEPVLTSLGSSCAAFSGTYFSTAPADWSEEQDRCMSHARLVLRPLSTVVTV